MEVSVTIDTRDFPDHPTSGIVLRGVGARYDDRTSGAQSFDKVEGEAAGFLPIAGGRVVLALHGWYVGTEARNAEASCRSTCSRVSAARTRCVRSPTIASTTINMLVANAEMRFALMTHLDLAVFADAGNVRRAPQRSRSREAIVWRRIPLHTRRETFATVDVAQRQRRLALPVPPEGSARALASRTTKSTLVPFVP